jgi:hypothetical protein
MVIELDVQRRFDSQLSQHLPEFIEVRLGLNVLCCGLG